ncbi:MAG: DUF3090 domain-containing protein [Acidimicrobiales bacterium]|nr:DUF3090 domain-containing protein [Acidimicrobiales bacterium]
MSTSFELDAPDRFTAGAVGPPGQRVFYLQAAQRGSVVSLRLEKQQVAALAEYLTGILADLPEVTEALPTELELVEPVVPEWVVGALAVAYEESSDRILLVAEELVDESDDESRPGTDDAGAARFRLSRPQVKAFIIHATRIVTSGRPFCPFCGRPMDPDGHVCPRSNGHGRT